MVFKKESVGDVTTYKFNSSKKDQNGFTVIFYQLGDILIDTGHYRNRKRVLEVLDDEHLNIILLTHFHEDHSGNALAISQRKHIDVLGHPITAEKLKNGFSILPYQYFMFGNAPPVIVQSYPSIIETDRYTLYPIYTPGHSKDHTVYLEKENGWLFSGDLYLSSKIKYFRSDEYIVDQIQSLKTILAYDFDALFCTFNPCVTGGKNKLREKLDFMENFYGDILQEKQKGHSERSIIQRMKNREVKIVKWVTMGNVSFENMIRSAYRSLPNE
jgi:glyoxylase-like metal-dependent hydrolase (beta-lactamase superfamily II)